jgi:uncharacterized protein YbjT (DUF2867 family)
MNVLVLGATGKTGRPLVAALRARRLAVRAACRNPAPAGDGVTRVVFDPFAAFLAATPAKD